MSSGWAWDGTDGEYLAHFGIKGMKWGQRRFQNPDGSLTSAGEKRYSHSPEGLGYKPLKGKKGDIVQKRLGKNTGVLEKKARKLEKRASKIERKNDGQSSDKSKALRARAGEAKNAAKLARSMQKSYASMSKMDRKSIRRGYMISRAAFINGGALGGTIGALTRGNAASKLAAKSLGTDRKGVAKYMAGNAEQRKNRRGYYMAKVFR